MIGLAKIVAEQIEIEPEMQAYEVFELLSDGTIEISPTDADCAGTFTMDDVEECYRFL